MESSNYLDELIKSAEGEVKNHPGARMTDQQLARLRKRHAARRIAASVGDMGSAIANMVAVNRYAPNAYAPGRESSEMLRKRHDKMMEDYSGQREAYRKAQENLYRLKQLRKAQQDADAERERSLETYNYNLSQRPVKEAQEQERLRELKAKADYEEAKAAGYGDLQDSIEYRNYNTGKGKSGGGGSVGKSTNWSKGVAFCGKMYYSLDSYKKAVAEKMKEYDISRKEKYERYNPGTGTGWSEHDAKLEDLAVQCEREWKRRQGGAGGSGSQGGTGNSGSSAGSGSSGGSRRKTADLGGGGSGSRGKKRTHANL